jgi:PAS domain S-box-containing protein
MMTTDKAPSSRSDRWNRLVQSLVSRLHGYTAALAALAAAMALHYLCILVFREECAGIFFVYLAAILIGGWCGYGPGILIVLLVVAGVPYLFEPGFSISEVNLAGLAVLLLVSVVISGTAASRRYAERLLREMNEGLEKRVQQQTAELAQANAALERQLAEVEAARAEAESSRQWLHTTLASIGDAVIVTDDQSNVKFLNGAAQSLTGWNSADASGRPLTEVFRVVDESSRETVESPAAKAMREGTVTGLADHAILIPRRGVEIPIDDSGAPVRDAGGKIIGIVLVFRDVTERRRNEQVLRESEQRFRLMTDAAPVMVWEAGADKRRTYVNKGWLDFTGRTLEQELSSGGPHGVHPDDLQRFRELYGGSFEARREFRMEYRLRHADGEYRWVADHGVPRVSPDGSFLGYIGACIDITDRKNAEQVRTALLSEAQSARNAAERASRLKDEFLATLSHELRTPLQAILGYSTLLRTGKLDSSAVAKAVEAIERNAHAQARLVEEILDVSRIITGRLPMDLRQVDIGPLAEAALESVRPAAAAKGVTIVAAIRGAAGLVLADANRIQQAMWNLLSNAVKFTPRGGQISLNVAPINSSIEIAVADTGIGIDPEFLPHVFERFRQADPSSTRMYGGLGLGLSLVRHIAELHGGTVRAESAGTGRGAVFRMNLPLRSLDVPEVELLHTAEGVAEPLPQGLLQGLRILVVDDETDTRELLALLLKQYGANVTTAGSAAKALTLLKESPPDVLVSDIGMPGEDGLSLIKKVRLTTPPVSQVPALALTGFAADTDRQKVAAAGFQAHLPKPIQPTKLVSAVANLARPR